MIIVLEGANGVGKSTYTASLEEHGYKQINPFRNGADTHNAAGELTKLNDAYGLGLNTHVEDLYVWELLAELEPAENIILDRTIPSAIAYGDVFKHPWYPYSDKKEAQLLFNLWVSQIRRVSCPVLYVWLEAPYKVAKKRCDGRWVPKPREYDKLETWFKAMFYELAKLPSGAVYKLRIDTTKFDVKHGVRSIIKVSKQCQH